MASALNFSAFIEGFLQFLSFEKGLTKNTQDSYRSDLGALFSFLQKRKIKSIHDVQKQNLIDYLFSEKAKGVSASTLARKGASIRAFFRYLVRDQLLSHNPAEVLSSPKKWQLIPEVLSHQEVNRLLKG